MSTSGRRSPLLEMHSKLGAKLTEFAGWSMPLQYSGIVAEHNAVRSSAGVFDVSHLGKLRVRGEKEGSALDEALTADLSSLEVGRARYALALDDDGGCIDDLFVYRVGAYDWLVVPNASNVDAIAETISGCGAATTDEWDRWAVLALQGPQSFDVFERVFPGSGATELRLHSFRAIDFLGEPGLVARTGYTGERGFELYVPALRSVEVFSALLEAGAAPIGLGARDTLRLEMGYALYGHELTRDTNPLEAGLGWALQWDSSFRGRDALARVRDRGGPSRRLFGIRCEDKGVPRQGYGVETRGEAIGTVTSGNFSPTLKKGIALALGPSGTTPDAGEEASVAARGRDLRAIIVKPPFIDKP